MSRDTSFPKDDHRNFNRAGGAFDVGETFSGVDFETGLEAAEKLDFELAATLRDRIARAIFERVPSGFEESPA